MLNGSIALIDGVENDRGYRAMASLKHHLMVLSSLLSIAQAQILKSFARLMG